MILSYIKLKVIKLKKKNKTNKTIFVAGHEGMVGSAIVKKLQHEGYKKIITISKSKLDLRNQQKVHEFFKKRKIHEVYMAAAKVGGILANKNEPFSFLYDNLMIAFNIINSSIKTKVGKILFFGSSCIYPQFCKLPISEDSLLTGLVEKNNESFAIAKIAAIKLMQSFEKEFPKNKIDFRCLMPCNIYGPGDNYSDKNSHLIPSLIKRFHDAKTQNKKEVIIWGSGSPKRENLYVEDLADASFFVMNLNKNVYQKNLPKLRNYINVGSREEYAILQIAKLIKNIVGFNGSIRNDLNKPDGVKRKKLNTKIITNLKWKPKISLRKGLILTYKAYLRDLNK
jgi:GDP-L-fucose synthase